MRNPLRSRFLLGVMMVLFALGLPKPSTGQNTTIVYRTSFEIPNISGKWRKFDGGETFDGWNVSGNSVDIVRGEWEAVNGLQSVDLDGYSAGSISRNLKTIPGKTYVLRFAVSGNPSGGPSVKKMVVKWGDEIVTRISFDTSGYSPLDMGWKYYSFQVVAPRNQTRLMFGSLTNSGYGPVIDDVSVALQD